MKVFLSSTAQDLDAYRKVADDTIQRLAQQAVVMERFGPLPGMPVEECERLARESDVLVCIVAHRYGFIPEKGRGSITRREVEAAHKAGRDVLVWIVADDHPWSEKQEQDLLTSPDVLASPERIAEVTEAVRELVAFKSWLLTNFTPERFTMPDDLGRKIAVALSNYLRGHAAPPVSEDKISISRLPTSGAELFGREAELQVLDDAWAHPNMNIVSFLAWGGVGKTALVNHWLKRRMARDNYRGADRVYAWSFFNQGVKEGESSADLFIDQALRWFGDKDPTTGNPWDKGERLAGLIRKTRTLLILDGLEPLQHPPGPQEGRLKDPAVQTLLVELAAQQAGLCVISTRARVSDLVDFDNGTVIQHNLEYLSPQAGAQILRSLNVSGEDKELEAAAIELGGHAFSLTLLGSYLDEALAGDIRRRKEIENLFDDTRYGDAAHKMIAAYEKWLGEGMEVSLLRLLGLFDRPADLKSIQAVLAPPAITGLTEPLQGYKGSEWSRAVAKLRRIKLLGEEAPTEPGMLDAHPLIREHFKQELKRKHPDAWRDANDRLYLHLRDTAKKLPETVEEMTPLFAAVVHGCAADKHQEVLDKVYWERISREDVHFTFRKLGTFGADLAAFSNFFDSLWDKPRASLKDPDKAFLLGQSGMALRALGRLTEAVDTMRAGYESYIAMNRLENATIAAKNLSELYVIIGELEQSLVFAQRSIELADQVQIEFRRMNTRTRAADTLGKMGRFDEAVSLFSEAEAIKGALHPDAPVLYSVSGFNYCDLLLSEGRIQEVKDRAMQMILIAMAQQSLLDVAIENLLFGRTLVLQAQKTGTTDLSDAANILHSAVKGLREAGHMDYVARGLLVRAEFYRLTSNYEKADLDLAEMYRIAARSGMRLHLADFHLESARLRSAQRNNEKAREHLNLAREMINRMGYHRRDREVQELEALLA